MQEGHVIQTENTHFLLFLLRNCPLRAWHRYDRKLGKTVIFINVREDQVDRFLSKVIKGSAGFNDVSEKGMIFRSLPVLFLRYTLVVCKGNCCGSSSRNRYTQTEPSEDWDTSHLSVQMNWCTIPYGFSLLRRSLSDFFLSVLLLL